VVPSVFVIDPHRSKHSHRLPRPAAHRFRSLVVTAVSAAALAAACGSSRRPAVTEDAGGMPPDGGGTGGAGTGGSAAGGAGGYMGPVTMATALFPAPGSENVCPDPPLRLTFSGPPVLGTAGKIQIWSLSDPSEPAATVDMALAMSPQMIGGFAFNVPRPVFVDGNDAIVRLRSQALAYGQTYYVTVEGGAIFGPDGGSVVVNDDTTWRFTTAAAGPTDPTALAVTRDGSAGFCSVQGALNAVPAGNNAAVTITIGTGTYYEIIYFTGKNNVTLRGEDRKLTVIAGINNNSINGSARGRALVGIDASTGLVVENLTIKNLTPQGGSQAEALRLGNCQMCVVRDVDIISLQDTVQWSGRIYASNCYIEGNVDFIWGTGVAYFKGCEIKTVGRPGYNVQARNLANTHGYVFVDSKITSAPGITGNVLGRIDATAYPASSVVYIDCELGSHISPAGWQISNGTDTSMLRFWEYRSRDAAGNPIDVSQRLPASRQLTEAEAAMMRDPAMVLLGWQPPP
jgi:hypothetical protein